MNGYTKCSIYKILIHPTSWLNHENMLNEISQMQKKPNHLRFHLRDVPGIGKFINTENKTEVTADWG